MMLPGMRRGAGDMPQRNIFNLGTLRWIGVGGCSLCMNPALL